MRPMRSEPCCARGRIKSFPVRRRAAAARTVVHAVDDVSLEVRRGETLGLVGETGCGKSTLARCIARLYDLTRARSRSTGRDISALSGREMRALRRDIQMIFQDPYGSLNPRRRVGSIIGDPFVDPRHGSCGTSASAASQELMERVGSTPSTTTGSRASSPAASASGSAWPGPWRCARSWSICDEPVSALDVSIQAQIINLLLDLQDELRSDATSSSPTTCRWCATSATGSR